MGAWIDRHAVTDATKDGYRVTARAWVKKTFAGRTIAQVASDRDRVADLLAKDMGHLSITRRRQARSSNIPAGRRSASRSLPCSRRWPRSDGQS